MWLRGDDVTLGSGTEVAQWNDKLGLGRHMVQATATKRPALIASDVRFNGKPTVDFDGLDDYLTGVGISTLFGIAQQVSLLVVFRADAITGAGAITAPYNNNLVAGAAGNIGLSLHNPSTAYAFTNDGAYQVATNPIAANVTAWAFLTVNAGTINVTINGVAGTPDTTGSMTIGAQVFALGSNFTYVANFLNGAIAEVFASTLPLTAQDAICWPNYCRFNYGTP